MASQACAQTSENAAVGPEKVRLRSETLNEPDRGESALAELTPGREMQTKKKTAAGFSYFQYSCFTQSTSITHSPSIGSVVILA